MTQEEVMELYRNYKRVKYPLPCTDPKSECYEYQEAKE